LADSKKPAVDSITWRDLTVKNAEAVRDFYSKVVGWKTSSVDMGGYNDFNMNPPAAARPRRGRDGVNQQVNR